MRRSRTRRRDRWLTSGVRSEIQAILSLKRGVKEWSKRGPESGGGDDRMARRDCDEEDGTEESHD